MVRKAVKTGFKGFTLSELLVALAILGVIATFTIPKVLQSQQDNSKKAIAKEAAAMVSEAFVLYKQENTLTSSFEPRMLKKYLNYVKEETAGQLVDGAVTENSYACSATRVCLKLHNGGTLLLEGGETFAATTNNRFVWVLIDPDGSYSGSSTGPGKGLWFGLFYNGRLSTWQQFPADATNSNGLWGPCAGCDPTWFSWN